MSTETPEIRQKRRKEERPDEILAAALTVFARDGFAAARLDEIADRAGCTKGTIYVYFDSKEDLFKAVVRKLIVPSFRKVEVVLQDESLDTVTRIKFFIEAAYREIVENSLHVAMMRLLIADGPKFPDLVDFYLEEVKRPGHEILEAVIARGIERGELRPIAPDVATHVLIAPILAEGVRRLLHAGGRQVVDPDRLRETHLDLVLNGLLAEPKK